MRMILAEGERRKEAFCNRIISWRFKIFLDARCAGLLSSRTYKSPDLARAAGERMIKKLRNINDV